MGAFFILPLIKHIYRSSQFQYSDGATAYLWRKLKAMRNYTAIYSTEFLKNIHYSFKAASMADAKRFRKQKFSAKRVRIIEEN
jgi:hypothetical protein